MLLWPPHHEDFLGILVILQLPLDCATAVSHIEVLPLCHKHGTESEAALTVLRGAGVKEPLFHLRAHPTNF